MGKLILFNMMSLDGFFEGKIGDLSWHQVDDEFNRFALEQLNAADHLIFGRKTYELMAAYWPSRQALANDPLIAQRMNELSKHVFSTTLEQADWENTSLYRDDPVAAVSSLKQQSEKDLLMLGSAHLSQHLMKHRLIDLYRVMLNPVLLGSGRPLFTDSGRQQELVLKKVKPFTSGNVLLEYLWKNSR